MTCLVEGLAQWQNLLGLAAQHTEDHDAPGCPVAGVPPDRLAYVTGHAPATGREQQPLPQQQQQQQQQQQPKQHRLTKARVTNEGQSQQHSTGRQEQQPKVQQQKQQQEQQPTKPRARPAGNTAELKATAAVLAAALAPKPTAREAGATAKKAATGAAAGAGAAVGASTAGPGATPSQEQLLALLARYLPAEPETGPGDGSTMQASSRSASASVAGVGREAQQEAGSTLWEQLGMAAGGPRVGGLGFDLRRLWQLAYLERGGFEAVTSAAADSDHGWAGVAEALGSSKQQAADGEGGKGKAALLAMECYRRWLLPYERHVRAGKANGDSSTGATAAAGGEAAAEGAEPSRKRKAA